MKLLILVVVSILLAACAPAKKQDPVIADLESQRVLCASETVDNLHDIVYPDGVVRKSELLQCNHGCARYRYVNDFNFTITICGGI